MAIYCRLPRTVKDMAELAMPQVTWRIAKNLRHAHLAESVLGEKLH